MKIEPELRLGIDHKLIQAIIQTESAGNVYAVRYEAHWKWFVKPHVYAEKLGITVETERRLQMFSWGPMQIMGATSRELQFELELPRLCDSFYGVKYGCMYLKKQLDRYSGNVEKAIAAYNAGTAKMQRNGKKFINQEYVDKVMDYRSKL
jgi:soluble lytic murein transglycosylase-like protein